MAISIIVTRGIIVSYLAIEKLVALRCTSSKNWNGNPNAVRDSKGAVSRARVYPMDVPLSKRHSIEICVDCSRLTSHVFIKISFQITFTFMIGKFYKVDRNGNCNGLRPLKMYSKSQIFFFFIYFERALTILEKR